MVVNLILQRVSATSNDTIGKLIDERGIFYCHTMEDEGREVKVPKETRIPAGRYRLKIRKQLTTLTKKYLADDRLKPWFKYHIEITGIEGFKNVYIHIGNKETHTDGCVLVGLWKDQRVRYITKSVFVYKHFYTTYYPIIENKDNEVYLDIYDEEKIAV